MKLEYLRAYMALKRQMSLIPAKLMEFSGPWDANGYNDGCITDDLVTDIYVSFSDQTRKSESQELLRTLTGQWNGTDCTLSTHMPSEQAICLSLDNTMKVAAKALVVDTSGTHSRLMKGGILSALSERNLIIAWVRAVISLIPKPSKYIHLTQCRPQRLCQSGSPVEAQELLEGLKRRCIALGVPEPEMAVVDNCCSVHNQLTNSMPDLQVVLDVYHFLMR
jgi:hypothetical protein